MNANDLILYLRTNIPSEGKKMTVYQLGDGKEYPVIMRGIQSTGIIPHYIVETVNPEQRYDGYSCFCVPASCIKELKEMLL